MSQAKCCKCGRPLTDPFSIAIGMGPECRGRLSKKGWKFPKPKYRVRHGRVELVGMVGKIVEPPPVGDLTNRKVKRGSKSEGDRSQRTGPRRVPGMREQ